MSCFKLCSLLLIIFFNSALGQISGIINSYAKVTTINPTCNFVTVSTTAGFNVGDKGILIQMKGASIDGNGNVVSYNGAGNYELVTIASIQSNDIYFTNTLVNNYDPTKLVQLVNMPVYGNITVNGLLTAKPWDGDTGGILAFEVSDTLKLNANIDVSGQGFRGGKQNLNGGGTCGASTNFTANTNVDAAGKGESIYIPLTNQENGRARIANGGGGGLAQNTGGGGGGGAGVGGFGGNQSSGCGTFSLSFPGVGGSSLNISNVNNRIFLGGGGGAGQQNNLTNGGRSTPGGHGGGIIFLRANTLISNGYQIFAQGYVSAISPAYGDGAGGGGAGGGVMLDITNLNTSLTINASGGKGDNVFNDNFRNIGPGGGGGGGYIWVTQPSLNANIMTITNGGIAGIVYGFATNCNCNHGALAGGNGLIINNLNPPKSITLSACALPVNLLSFEIFNDGDYNTLEWKVSKESKMKYYIVLKSIDNLEFDTLAIVAANNSFFTQNYVYEDKNSAFQESVFYRIVQVDNDGNSTILATKEGKKLFDIQNFSISPNPAFDYIWIRSNMKVPYQLVITDLAGKLLLTNQIDEYNYKANIEQIEKGIYLIQIVTDQKRHVYKLIKS